jgi:hypothetical protein
VVIQIRQLLCKVFGHKWIRYSLGKVTADGYTLSKVRTCKRCKLHELDMDAKIYF